MKTNRKKEQTTTSSLSLLLLRTVQQNVYHNDTSVTITNKNRTSIKINRQSGQRITHCFIEHRYYIARMATEARCISATMTMSSLSVALDFAST